MLVVQSRARAVLAAAAVAAFLWLLFADRAGAYSHTQSCNQPSAGVCWDFVGQTYNAWERIQNSMSGGAVVSEVCAKGVTAAGNIRNGSGCSNNTSFRDSDIVGGTPESRAYAYWGGAGGSRAFSLFAVT